MTLSPLLKGHTFTLLVRELVHLINGEVIITKHKGIIVVSTDGNRIGNFQEGAQYAMR